MKTKEEQKEYQKKYHEEHREHLKEYCKEWNKKNPNYDKTPRRKKTLREYNQKPETKAYHKKWYQDNKEKMKEYNKEYSRTYYQKPEVKAKKKEYNQRPEIKAYYKKYHEEHRKESKVRRNKPKNKKKMYEQTRESKLKKKYNLSIKDYNNLLKQQGGVCAICRKKERTKRNGIPTYLCVDHNWSTKKVRGLLCKDCNTSLGNLKEDISLFYKCIKYLKKNQS